VDGRAAIEIRPRAGIDEGVLSYRHLSRPNRQRRYDQKESNCTAQSTVSNHSLFPSCLAIKSATAEIPLSFLGVPRCRLLFITLVFIAYNEA
jgi:hypothetical protein